MLDTRQEIEHGTHKLYWLGFILSILLTLAAYFVVSKRLLEGFASNSAVIGLAALQAVVQLLFFLHLGKESKPRWNLIVFFFMLLIVAVVIAGSLWIMHNLDYRMEYKS